MSPPAARECLHLYTGPQVMPTPTPSFYATLPSFQITLTRIINLQTEECFWHAAIVGTNITAQGPTILWCLGRLGNHYLPLRNEVQFYGNN